MDGYIGAALGVAIGNLVLAMILKTEEPALTGIGFAIIALVLVVHHGAYDE